MVLSREEKYLNDTEGGGQVRSYAPWHHSEETAAVRMEALVQPKYKYFWQSIEQYQE